MPDQPDAPPEQGLLAPSPIDEKAKRIAEEREALLSAVSAGRLDTVQERVAFILNHYPGTRDSDITLQLRYWDVFEQELTSGSSIQKADLYKLARLTSLTRARAKIQNTYRLFQASTEVQKHRGKLEDEELQKAREQQIDYPAVSVYADESGKTDDYLVVGSVWFLHPPDEAKFFRELYAWKEKEGFEGEFHFTDIGSGNVDKYLQFARFLAGKTSVISFKAVTVARRGVNPEKALAEMYYQLLVKGVDHENASGRAPLPRAFVLTKDLENESQDKLFLASLDDRLKQAAQTRFNGNLFVDRLNAEDSKGNIVLQIADLFTGSIRRTLNQQLGEHPKDRFALTLLGLIGMPGGPSEQVIEADMALHIQL
jgi:Protein of unknown function (DUF3800)